MQILQLTKQLLTPPLAYSHFSNTILQSTNSKLIPPQLLSIGGVRFKIRKAKFNHPPQEGEQVIKCHRFNFYPRFPDHVDPPYEPTKLFAVRRIKCLNGRPYWERRIVEGELGLGARSKVTITKNTPGMNATLYKVKHLIQITPITFPNGIPSDPKQAFLKENGEFISYNVLSPIGSESIEQAQEDVQKLWKRNVDGATLKNRLSLQWQSKW